ncbi:MAG TPA: transporter substrate-binding domain-containing protein [bacterium]|nr:transporter substrate-binding domain-containing protein [bacterium]
MDLRLRRLALRTLLVTGILAMGSLLAFASVVDEFGTSGPILGVSFTGGDGSYKRAVQNGVRLIIASDFPWTYQDPKTHEFAGIDVDVLRDAVRRLGISKVSIQLVAPDAMVPTLLSNRGDVIGDNIHENPKRLKVIAFTGPAYWYGGGVAVFKGNPKSVHSWADLSGKVVSTYRGTFYQPILEARKDIKEIKLYTTSEAEFADLSAGRIDVAVDDFMKIKQVIKNNPGLNIELTDVRIPPAQELGYARYALRKQDVDLNSALSRALEEMRADGTIMKFIVKGGLPASYVFNYPVPTQ